jgi:hypothetical protein
MLTMKEIQKPDKGAVGCPSVSVDVKLVKTQKQNLSVNP